MRCPCGENSLSCVWCEAGGFSLFSPLMTQTRSTHKNRSSPAGTSSYILLPRSLPAITRRAFFELQISQNRVAKVFQFFHFLHHRNETKVKCLLADAAGFNSPLTPSPRRSMSHCSPAPAFGSGKIHSPLLQNPRSILRADMPATFEHHQARIRYQPMQQASVVRGDDNVFFAPDQQGGL